VVASNEVLPVHHLSDNFNSITSVPGNGVSGHAVLGDASEPADASVSALPHYVSALPHYGWLWKKVICVCVREREKEKGGKTQARKFDNVNSLSLIFFPQLDLFVQRVLRRNGPVVMLYSTALIFFICVFIFFFMVGSE